MKARATLVGALLAVVSVALIAATARSASDGLHRSSRMPAPIPSPGNSIVPPFIALVGNDGSGRVDGAGNFTITVRDNNNIPINGSLVVVDLSGCIGGDWLCATQNPGLTADNATKTVYGFANGAGVITMTIGGHGTNLGNTPPYHAEGCVKVYADGVLMTPAGINLRVYDQDGNGLAPGDFAAVLGDFFGRQSLRCDYDNSGDLGPNDLSMWLSVFFSRAPSDTGSGSNCPATGSQYSIP